MLSIQNLVKVYPGPVCALQGIDLEVPKGMFGLLGPNGAGKTTFMRIVAGLLEPTSGSVLLDGVDVVADPTVMWKSLGYLPQEFGFYPHLTGAAMLAYLLRLKGIEPPAGMRMKHFCIELLERVNLSFAAGRKIKGYSGGMKQRLGVAQAIAGNPRVIIVDEPTAGLDPKERLRFYRILAELAEDRIVLLSTHIVEDVAVLCRRFAVIRQGQFVAVTSPAEARAAIDGTIFEGRVSPDDLDQVRRTRCVTQALLIEGQNLVRIHEPGGDAPERFEPAAPTLEDAYLLMMRNGTIRERNDAVMSSRVRTHP